MRRTATTLALLTLAIATPVLAQKTTQTGVGGGGSPHVKSEWVAAGANISIEYGRPFLKGRPDETLMKNNGVPWRTGADAATVLTTDKPITIGAIALTPGSYTLNAMIGATEWHLIVGKLSKPGQWGVPYQAALEIGRAPMKLGKTAAPVEQVTYSIDTSATGGTIRLEWGTKSATVPFTVGK